MIIHVPLSQIQDNPYQSRTEYGEIEELAADILRHAPTRPGTFGLQQVPSGRLTADDGLLVPTAKLDPGEWLIDMITVRPGWIVQLEFGHRRVRAFKHLFDGGCLEYGRMPVNILDLTDADMLDGVWSENSARRNLSAVEEAELLQKKLATVASQREVADAWGLSRPLVANRLRLLSLPPEIQQANRDGRLSERQCLALAPVLAVQEKANGAFKTGNWWQDDPEKYVQSVLTKGEAHTSDDIRDYANRAIKHAGIQIPGRVAKLDCATAPVKDLVQPESCKGCPQRIQDYCLNKKCLQAKLRFYGRTQAEAAAEKLGYPYSDGWDMEDNDTFANYQGWKNEARRKELAALHQAGGCPHIVVGWDTLNGYGVRPFYDSPTMIGYVTPDAAHNGDNPLSGAVLGHVGSHAACLAAKDIEAAGAEEEELAPSQALQSKWEKDDNKQKRAIRKAVAETVAEVLTETVYEAEVLVVLLALANWLKEDTDRSDFDALAGRLVSRLLYYGPLDDNYRRAHEHYRIALTILDAAHTDGRAILDQALGGTKAEALNARARRALYRWLHSRRWANLEKLQEQAAEIQAVRAIYDEIGPVHDSEVSEELLPWLENAARDIGGRIAEHLAKYETVEEEEE